MMTDKEKTLTIKPCPFCGSNNVHVYLYGAWKNGYVRCDDCFALAPDPSATDYESGEAIDIWNNRV